MAKEWFPTAAAAKTTFFMFDFMRLKDAREKKKEESNLRWMLLKYKRRMSERFAGSEGGPEGGRGSVV